MNIIAETWQIYVILNNIIKSCTLLYKPCLWQVTRMNFTFNKNAQCSSMTLLTVTDYLCHKCPWICSACHNHNSVLSSFRTYHRIYDKSITTGITCAPGSAYSYGALEFTPVSSGVCVMLCTSLFSFVHCLVCSSSMYGLWLVSSKFKLIQQETS